ncbi:MAG: glycosyltransferase [Rhodothermales bacterium]
MINLLGATAVALGVAYVLMALACRRGLLAIHEKPPAAAASTFQAASILIAAKNEEASIGRCLDALAQQTAPIGEIIVVNDQSSDATEEVVRSHRLYGASVRLVSTTGWSTGKSSAIRTGLDATSADIILVTDADCRQSPGWTSQMLGHLTEDVGFVAGPVLFEDDGSIFGRLQSLEFLGLVAVGAGSIGSGLPTICNSANLCYRKDVFEDESTRHPEIASLPGFDEALLQTIHARQDWRVAFAPGLDAAVYSDPATSLSDFLRQRIRWSSMAGRFPDRRIRIISIAVFVFYVLLLGLAAGALAGIVSAWLAIALVLTKASGDALILWPAARLYRREPLLRLFPLAALLQPFYIVFVSTMGLFATDRW